MHITNDDESKIGQGLKGDKGVRVQGRFGGRKEKEKMM